MTREEFKVIVKAMMAAYSQSCPVKSQDVFDMWYTMLKDMDYRTVSERLKKHIQVNKFAPTIAELRGVDEERKGSFYRMSHRQYNMDELEKRLLESSCIGERKAVQG